MTITAFGSIRQIRSESCWESTRERRSAWTEENPGAPGTTSRRESSTGWRRITGFLTGCMGRNRIAARRGSRAAETTDRLRSAIGFRWGQEKAAIRFPIRWTRTWFTTRGPAGAWVACGNPRHTGEIVHQGGLQLAAATGDTSLFRG